MKLSVLFLLLFAILFLNPAKAQEPGFSLDGKTFGIEDGTYLYLRDLVNGGNIDSAMVKENRFRFETLLPEEKLFVMLHTRDRVHFKELWLEDRPMSLDATAGPFAAAEITGSRDQELAEKMKEEVYKDVREISKEELKQRQQEFIAQHPNALPSAYILNGATREWEQDEIAVYYEKLSESTQHSSMGKRVASYLAKDLPEVGEKYIDLSIPDQSGELKRISYLSGELTLLQFWSSTCGWSRNAHPGLSDLYQEYGPKGFQVISISKDTNPQKWQQAIEEDRLSWPQLSHLDGWKGEAFKAYGVRSTPSSFLIDSEGVIIDRNLRPEELADRLAELLED